MKASQAGHVDNWPWLQGRIFAGEIVMSSPDAEPIAHEPIEDESLEEDDELSEEDEDGDL